MKPRTKKNYGVSAGQDVMNVLAQDEPTTIASIAQALKRSPEPVSQTVHRLKRKGWVRRVNGQGPGKPGQYALTPKGKKALS